MPNIKELIKIYKALKWIKENNGKVTFSNSTNNKKLCMVEVGSCKSVTYSLLESARSVRDKIGRKK